MPRASAANTGDSGSSSGSRQFDGVARSIFASAPFHLLSSCGSACLLYLARKSRQKTSYLIDPSLAALNTTFRWDGMQIEYAQVAIALVLYQLATLDFAGLVGTIIGYAFDDLFEMSSPFLV
jgi:hypothetical protein